MILKYSDSFKGLLGYSGIFQRLGRDTHIAIYSGDKPKPDDYVNNWKLYNCSSKNLLWVGNNYSFTATVTDNKTTITSVVPGYLKKDRVSINNGDMKWFALLTGLNDYQTPILEQSSPWTEDTLKYPSWQSVIIGDVTANPGEGFVRISTTTNSQPGRAYKFWIGGTI